MTAPTRIAIVVAAWLLMTVAIAWLTHPHNLTPLVGSLLGFGVWAGAAFVWKAPP